MQPQDTGYIQEGFGDPTGDLPRRIYPFQALKSMIAECDFLVISVPLTPETNGLIGAEELDAMKPNSFLIDVSRGSVIDHIALIRALKDKKICRSRPGCFPRRTFIQRQPIMEISKCDLKSTYCRCLTPLRSTRGGFIHRKFTALPGWGTTAQPVRN